MKLAQRIKLLEGTAYLRRGAPLPEWLLAMPVAHSADDAESSCTEEDLFLDLPSLGPTELMQRLQVLGIPKAAAEKMCRDEGVDGALFLRLGKDDLMGELELARSVASRVREIQRQHTAVAQAAHLVAEDVPADEVVTVPRAQLHALFSAYTRAQQLWHGVREAVGGLQDEYLCPITHEPLQDPVVATDGAVLRRGGGEGCCCF